jgi:hypothetical protein
MKKINYLVFLSLAGLLFFAGPVLADLGISPQDWKEPNGLPGQQIEKTFVLSRNDVESDLSFTSKISGDLESWIKIENGNVFTIPKDQQQYPVKVIINIPQNAEKKEYKSEIRLRPAPGAAGGQVSVIVEALIRIDLTVTDKQFLSYVVQQIKIPQQEEGKNVNIILDITNKGNILAKPTKVTVDFFDKYYATKLSSQTFTDFSGVQGIAPFSNGEITLQVPTQLTPEQYWADISVYHDDQVLKSDHLTFEIVKAGTLKKEVVVEKIFKNNNLLIFTGVILLVIIIVTVIIILIIKKKPKKENPDIKEDEEAIH